jgi:hypothetical protein
MVIRLTESVNGLPNVSNLEGVWNLGGASLGRGGRGDEDEGDGVFRPEVSFFECAGFIL